MSNDSDPAAELLSEMTAAIGRLTSTQQRRAEAALSGKGVREIAQGEGVSAAAVSESLNSAPVQQTLLTVAGWTVAQSSGGTPLLAQLMMGMVKIALGATRPVICGNVVEYAPDFRLRMEATERLLSFIAPPMKPHEANAERSDDEVVAREVHTREVRRRTRRAP